MSVTTATDLRANCLNLWEVLAQSIAMLGPTMTPVLIVPLMYASAGNASWLAYAFGTLMLLAVALNVREFATRSSSAGSLYEYARRAFGARGGLLCGWALLWAYAFVGIAGLTGFAVFARALLGFVHLDVPPLVASLACLALTFALAYRDIRLSTITLLFLEAGSVSLVVVLLAIVLAHGGTLVDPGQLSLRGATPAGIALGAVVAIFSLVGFESATSLGEEARDPLRTIPNAVIASVLVSGAFFVLCAYAEVLGARPLATSLDKLGTPLDALADGARVPLLKVAIDVGALLSSFSIALAALNAGGRAIYTMSREGVFAATFARSHPTLRTPHVALALTRDRSRPSSASSAAACSPRASRRSTPSTTRRRSDRSVSSRSTCSSPSARPSTCVASANCGRTTSASRRSPRRCSSFRRSAASIPCRRRRRIIFRTFFSFTRSSASAYCGRDANALRARPSRARRRPNRSCRRQATALRGSV